MGNFDFVFFALCLGYVLDANVRSFCRRVCTLTPRLRSYCCIIFQFLAHSRVYSPVYIGRCVLDSFCHVPINSLCGPIPFRSYVCSLSFLFRIFLLTFPFPFNVSPCVWWLFRCGRFMVCWSLERLSHRSCVSGKRVDIQICRLSQFVTVCGDADE